MICWGNQSLCDGLKDKCQMKTLVKRPQETFFITAKNRNQMETMPHLPISSRLSQSEAMLDAIRTGFFETFLEKSEVNQVWLRKGCRVIRLQVSSPPTGKGLICVKGINTKGEEQVLTVREVTLNHPVNPRTNGYVVEFSVAELIRLLDQPDCSGLRFFPGTLSGCQPTLVAVGVRTNGFDISTGHGYLRSHQVAVN